MDSALLFLWQFNSSVRFNTIFYRYLLIIGGGHEWESASLQQIHAFDTEENNWNTLACHEDVTHGFPRSRSSFGCELLHNNIYIFGGRHYTKQGGEWALNSCWRLDLELKTWERLNLTLPIDVYFHTSCLSSAGYVYLFGGISDDQKRINHIYRLRVFVPRLSEIAWERITGCIKNLSKKHIPILTRAGVPGNFIHRLSWYTECTVFWMKNQIVSLWMRQLNVTGNVL